MTITDEIDYVREWRDGQIVAISKIESKVHQRILITACIDAFVQHQESVCASRKQKRRTSARNDFSVFLQKYVVEEPYHEWMRLVCPTTLYYDYCDNSLQTKLKLDQFSHYAPDDPVAIQEAERLINLLPEDKQEKAREKHQYSALIYQMGNKLVHEMSYVGSDAIYFTEKSKKIPQMAIMKFTEDNKTILKKWTLHIPIDLLKYCLKESTDNYLNECLNQQKRPLGDYDPFPKSIFAFYD